MPIVPARPGDLRRIRQLIQRGRHVYTNFGSEDLAGFLQQGVSVVGAENGRLWGFLCIELEPKPDTLPPEVPMRAFLRSVTLAPGYSPTAEVTRLLDASFVLMRRARQQPNAASAAASPLVQIMYFATEDWLIKPLQLAGFEIPERVEFLYLDRLQRNTIEASAIEQAALSHIQLRSAQTSDLEALARLDAETFAPRWHFSSKQMLELMLSCRVRVAVRNRRFVGYSALSLRTALDGDRAEEAQLARLAVHPHAQGLGLGRLLLQDSLQHAQQQGCDVMVLNTQTDNQRAQQLYRSFGFRSTGEITPVLTKTVDLT